MQGLKQKSADEEKGGFRRSSFQVDRAWFRVGGMHRGRKARTRKTRRIEIKKTNGARDRNRRKQKTRID